MLPSGTISFNREISELRQTPAFSHVWAPLALHPAPSWGQGSCSVSLLGKLWETSAWLGYFLGCVVVAFFFSHQVSLPSLSLFAYKCEGLYSNSGTLRSIVSADEESFRERDGQVAFLRSSQRRAFSMSCFKRSKILGIPWWSRRFHCQGPGLIPGGGIKTLHAACGAAKNKSK